MHGTTDNASPAGGTPKLRLVDDAEPLLCSIPDTQRVLGKLSEREVYRLLDAGALEGVKIGKRRMVVVESIRAYVERLRNVA